MNPAAIEATALGRRYRQRWALRDCSVQLPQGHVIGLVGPNGAGKTTLLLLTVGRLRPTAGKVEVLGEPVRGRAELLARVGFVAQNKPLYRSFTVTDMLRFGARLNPSWDQSAAERRLTRLDIPLDQRVGALSGGQQAQVALAVALGKRPELLVLDEPIANLDPLARQEFLQVLMEEVAESGLTVVLSATGRQATLLVRTRGPIPDPAWTVRDVTLEQLMLAYMRHPEAETESQSLALADTRRPA